MIPRLHKLIGHGVRAAVILMLSTLLAPALAQTKTSTEATSRLFESIQENNLQGVMINAHGGADLGTLNPQGLTPIDLAIDKGYFEIVYFLMAFRKSRNAVFTSGKAAIQKNPPPPSIIAKDRQPTSTVAGVYSPPAGSDPWSPVVVTPDPPAPDLPLAGPSPFDPGARAPGSGLTIIGDIRGPPGTDTEFDDIPEIIVTPAPAPEPVVVFNLPVQTAPAAPVAEPAPVVIAKAFGPPLKKPSPPPQEPVQVATVAEPSPLFDEPDELPAPEPLPVEPVSVALVKPLPVAKQPVRPPPQRTLIPVETALPGKPKDERSFLDRIFSVFSLGEDDKPDDRPHSRVVMDLPPRPVDQVANLPLQDGNGWAVRSVEKTIRTSSPASATLQTTDPSGERLLTPLQNISLSLVDNLGLGLSPPKLGSEEFDKSCIEKKSGSLAFCIVGLAWPDDVAGLFAASTILYEGNKAIVRYDEGAATYYHTCFRPPRSPPLSNISPPGTAHRQNPSSVPSPPWPRPVSPTRRSSGKVSPR